jgi:hypothetical protein
MSDGDSNGTTQMEIEKVRASRAGHAYHEAWAAHTALELLPPSTNLAAITLEGFDKRDAELGNRRSRDCRSCPVPRRQGRCPGLIATVVQFEYSIASAEKAVRAADLASTLAKFAVTDAELPAKHGDDHVIAVVRYEFATNRRRQSQRLSWASKKAVT